VRLLVKSIAVVAVLVLVGAGLVMLAPRQVTLNMVNNSGKQIASMKVVDEKQTYEVGGISVGQARVFQFSARGETSFGLIARFDDGSEARGGVGYAENGYTFTATIEEATITSRLDKLSYL
jgi:hypothetical protein